MTRHIDADLLGAADAVEAALLEHAQQVAPGAWGRCRRSRRGRWCRCRPSRICRVFCWLAPVKAPFSWPNNSDSSRVSARAAQETATNGLAARSPRVVDGAGDHLLSGAALALNQHRAAQAGDVARRGPGRRSMRAFLLTMSWKLYWRASFLRRIGVLALQAFDLEDAADEQRDLLGVARLDDVLLRALLHGGDGGVDGGVGRDDDDGRVGDAGGGSASWSRCRPCRRAS